MSSQIKMFRRKNLNLKVVGPLRQEEESIYNLIKKVEAKPPKKKRYRSKYPFNMAPSYSTFGTHTTSQPIIINGSGNFKKFQTRKIFRSKHGNFGLPPGTIRPSPKNFLRRGHFNYVSQSVRFKTRK